MNTSDPTGWGRYQIEATSYHEGIPGHHLQLAISTELTAIPEFRKRAFIAAYGEGWGLYTRAARRRDGPVLDAARPDGDARGRLDAGLPARRRHRDARARLEPPEGDRLHDRQLADARSARSCPRSTATR